MTEQTVRLVIPNGLAFADLHLARDLATGVVRYNWHPIEVICMASGIEIAVFRDTPEDNVAGLLVSWYGAHREQGGEEDPVAEELILEVAKEEAIGLYRVTPERCN